MSTTSTALIVAKQPDAHARVDVEEVALYCERVVADVVRAGGPGTAKVISTARQFLMAIEEHQQGQRRLGAEVLRKDARTSGPPRVDRLLAAVANPDRST